jgi:formylglycine-generating enzyme required for sulfatase activity
MKIFFTLSFFIAIAIPAEAQSYSFTEKYYLPELLDNAAANKLKAQVNLQRQEYLKPPLKLADCVYFNDAMLHCFNDKGEFNLFPVMPPSLRFSTDAEKNSTDSISSIQFYSAVSLEKYTQPFYFRKYEVTNAEYWEFVRYVRDSITRINLAQNGFADEVFTDFDPKKNSQRYEDTDPYRQNTKKEIRWNTSDPDYRTALWLMFYLEDGFLPEDDAYWNRKKINTARLDYSYFYDADGIPIPIPRDGSCPFRDIVNVYPDTLCWTNDFNFPGCKKMSEVYFWHPAFADYPVVGITYNQAKAFLNWKTIEEQKKLDAKKIKLKVEYDLPNEIEWEIAATTELSEGKLNSYGNNFPALADNSWVTNLMLDSTGVKKSNGVPDFSPLRLFDPLHSADGYSFTAAVDLQKTKTTSEYELDGEKIMHTNSRILKQLDGCGISFMGGNVSEWINADYPAWLPAFLLRLQLLHSIQSPNAQLDYAREFYFNSFNSKTVPAKKPMVAHFLKPKVNKLVRGSNWYDERFTETFGKNPAGMNAKTFIDPELAYCTLGFRYVVRVKRK